MKVLYKILAVFLMIAPGLAAADAYTDMGLKQVKRIQQYKIDSWQAVDQYSLIIDGTPSTKYLVVFKNRCRDLRFATAIAAPTKGGSMQAGFDSISIIDRDKHPMPCMIKSIYEINGDRGKVKAIKAQVTKHHADKKNRK